MRASALQNQMNTLWRLIPPGQPRRVHFAKSFYGPGALLKDGLDTVVRVFEQGLDVNPWQSRGLKNSAYDRLLNDWLIHHFHLGTEVESDGFVKRTDSLLFARVTSNDVYCIGLFSHGCWADTFLLETIRRNWPHLLIEVGLADDVSDMDWGGLRKAGFSTAVVGLSDGKAYMAGLGSTMGGYPVGALFGSPSCTVTLR